MRKNTGKIIICIILSVLLVLGGTYLFRIVKEVNTRIERVKKGTPTQVTLTELSTGNYSSDTAKYLWSYTYVDENGKSVSNTTTGRYSKQELEETEYKMTVYVKGSESIEEPYLFGNNQESYKGAIIFYCLAVFPLLFIAWLIIQRILFNQVLEKGTVYYAEFLEAFREGSYYKVKFAFDVDGKRIVKTTKPAYSLNAVDVFKTNGMIEIKYYKNRAAISQKILGIKM